MMNSGDRTSKRRLTLREAADRVERALEVRGVAAERPVLILMTGLPGTGKTHISKLLERSLPAVIVQSDFVRKLLFPHPQYTGVESGVVYRTCQEVAARLLRKGVNVILDATYLQEKSRKVVYSLAEQAGAKVIVVRTTAPREVVLNRLRVRELGARPDNLSDATVAVYEAMERREQLPRRPYFNVNTDSEIRRVLEAILREACRHSCEE